MVRFHFPQKLFSFILFLQLISSEGKEPVTFIGERLLLKSPNKSYLFIIGNSSYFNKIGTYEFRLESYVDLNSSYFNYTFCSYSLPNYTYDFLNSFPFKYSSSEVEKNSYTFYDLGTQYYYTINFDVEKNFKYFIVKIPIITNEKLKIKTSEIFFKRTTTFKDILIVIILYLILSGLCLTGCVCGCCYCWGRISKLRYNNLLNMAPQPLNGSQGPVANHVYTNSEQNYFAVVN